jgi:tetratricopeptide (TPR) repeat protein
MIVFPSESVYELRRGLAARMKSGELSGAEVFHQALAADPDDSTALLFLGMAAEKAGDLAEAERLARAAICNHPSGHDGYMLLQRVLRTRGANTQLVSGYTELGLKKIAYDEEALERIDFAKGLPELPAKLLAGGGRNYELLQITLEHLEQTRLPEPPAVAEELEPHRLIHQLREAGDEPLSRELIEGILVRAADCAPMLLGILKEYGEDLIPEDDDPMVLRGLALLGEIGDPATLTEISEFLELEDESFGHVARWAFHRISFRQPAAALQAILEIIPQCDAMTRAAMALQICELPKVPGRFEALRSVLDDLEFQPKEDQEVVLIGAITAAWGMQGINSEFAASLQKQYGGVFSASTHRELRKLRTASAGMGPYVAAEDPVTIYEICGEDHGPTGPVVKPPGPGRNDPCWCGSGKKYKKCHLDADQGR